MITFKSGDMFTEERCNAFVCPVNCVGVMGKGLALTVKNRYPEYYKSYRISCQDRELVPGEFLSFATIGYPYYPTIIFLATKDHWKDPSKLEWIVAGLKKLRATCEYVGFKKIAVPALGCGLGGLDWEVVKQVMVDELQSSWVSFIVYEPRKESG